MTRYQVLRNAVLAVADKARAILPPTDVHGIDHVEQHFGVTYTEQQLISLVDLPWPDEVLRECAGTHLLVAGFPLSILDLFDRQSDLLWEEERGWLERGPFGREVRVHPRWYLLRKEAVPGSLDEKTYRAQLPLLTPYEEVPHASELAHATVLHFRATGERLLGRYWLRCADESSPGYRASVGFFISDLHVVGRWDDNRMDCLGLASARKLP